ncbi:phenylalanine--tRNA ligase subunit beta [Patescibacteria group bacterium]|nr:phenylalanine--tRNA ligase subunit beta [Patescibacteria group bacterium]
MNILIPDSWLKEHLKTKATPKQVANYLTLCSQTVEKIKKVNGDSVYETEITTNRPDCLSVYGIARELNAILPQFGIKAKLKEIAESKKEIPQVKKGLPLKVKINKPSLCPRFTALIFKNITIKPSPKIIQERLEKSGVRPLNNVIDISNYLMLESGQPMHTFDYDKIKKATMILREAKKGEKIVTLDKETRTLPTGAIVIEDGTGRIIDLCGIMGGANSEVDEKTKRVLLFVQTYDPMKIRRTCQALAFRTEAAARFEKGVNPEGVIPAMKKARIMFEKNCGAKVASELIDIYPNPQKAKTVKLDINQAEKLIGVKITKQKITNILESLGFSLVTDHQSLITFSVPHWRYDDVSIPEDLIEEIARIYGYHRLPSNLPRGKIPAVTKDSTFEWIYQIKNAFKNWGLTEVMSYSMVSQTQLEKTEIEPKECIKISNPLTEDLVYMRPSLIPSLLMVVSENNQDEITIFELANVYLYQKIDKLPDEAPMLTGLLTGEKFYQAKGVVESILATMGINNYQFEPYQLKRTFYGKVFHPARTAEVMVKKDSLGVVGEISPHVLARFGVKGRAVVFDLDFRELVKHASKAKKYTPIPKYPAIVEDLAFVVPPKTLIGEMLEEIKKVSKLTVSVELIDSYKNTRTFRITYQSPKKTLTDKEVEKIRKKIVQKVKTKFGAKLK